MFSDLMGVFQAVKILDLQMRIYTQRSTLMQESVDIRRYHIDVFALVQIGRANLIT